MINLNIKSLDRNSILLYKAFIVASLNKFNVSFNIVSLPGRRVRTALLKSSHVDKKSREQFQLTSHRLIFRVKIKLNSLILRSIVLNKPKTVKVALFRP